MDSREDTYLNSYNSANVENEKKYAKIIIVFAFVGVLAGLSACYMFFFVYKLVETPLLALISSIIASFVVYVHIQYMRNYWQIWTYQLKYWALTGFIMQGFFVLIFFICLILGAYYRQSNSFIKS